MKKKDSFSEKKILKRFISYYKPYKGLFVLDMGASLLMAAIGMVYPIVTRKIFKDYVPSNDENSTKMIIILGFVLIGIYIIRYGLRFFINYYGHVMGVKMQANMRSDLFNKLETLPFEFFDENETGKLMSRMSNDLQNVSELAHHGPENIFISSTTLILAFVYLLSINWILAVLILLCAPILLIVSLVTRKKQLNAFSQTRKDVAEINASLESSITGIRVTKVFNNKEKEVEKFEDSNKKYVKSRSNAYKYLGLYHSSTNFIIDLFNAACIVGGGLLAKLTGAFSVEDYLTFAVSISLFISPMTTLVNFVEQYQDGVTGFSRFMEIMEVESEKDAEDAIKDIKLNGDISFDHVSFDYETKGNILNDVSFKIKSGETIALVGESGGGKTTICHLLPRLYDVTKGNIYIDDIDTKKLSLKCLRDNIGIVQQDVFLFNGTIKENIAYGRLTATDEEIIDACKKANIYDFIQSLENGLDSQVGERGVKLSGGQKQRISIARIFLKNPSILILDEATSALDNTTEILIQESLNELAKDRTSIVVAHRLSTIKNADRIFVVVKGKIVESGTHEELLELNGDYARLYSQQFRVSSFKES